MTQQGISARPDLKVAARLAGEMKVLEDQRAEGLAELAAVTLKATSVGWCKLKPC